MASAVIVKLHTHTHTLVSSDVNKKHPGTVFMIVQEKK